MKEGQAWRGPDPSCRRPAVAVVPGPKAETGWRSGLEPGPKDRSELAVLLLAGRSGPRRAWPLARCRPAAAVTIPRALCCRSGPKPGPRDFELPAAGSPRVRPGWDWRVGYPSRSLRERGPLEPGAGAGLAACPRESFAPVRPRETSAGLVVAGPGAGRTREPAVAELGRLRHLPRRPAAEPDSGPGRSRARTEAAAAVAGPYRGWGCPIRLAAVIELADPRTGQARSLSLAGPTLQERPGAASQVPGPARRSSPHRASCRCCVSARWPPRSG